MTDLEIHFRYQIAKAVMEASGLSTKTARQDDITAKKTISPSTSISSPFKCSPFAASSRGAEDEY